MEIKASARYVRSSWRKINQVLSLIRGKDIENAQNILKFTPKKAAKIIEKVLLSAISNAGQHKDIDINDLYVFKAVVEQGPTLKRFRARARGRAGKILKRTSHIKIILKVRE